jgi:septal ring factor EnvC (AmiA/AmiB activator)
MRKEEKHRFGVGLIGDKVRKDIPQTLVSFGDHQILSPARDEHSARRVLQDCLLSGLLKQARDPLVEERELRDTAEDRQRRVRSRLGALQRQLAANSDDADINDEISAAQQELQEIEQQLDCLQGEIGNLDDHLERLVDGLERAPEQIQVEKCVLHLSNTHVLLDGQSEQQGIKVPLAEVKLGREPARVVSLTRYPRDEFKPSATLW